MKRIEVHGKTVEDAIDSALKELGASREDVDIEILSEGDRGLFGMKGAKQAKVRVTLKKP